MPEIWKAMTSLGFTVPHVYLKKLEKLQVPDPDVQSSQIYLKEWAKERLSCHFCYWSPASRPSGKSLSYRSKYLDCLQEKVDEGGWPQLGAAMQRSRVTLDPGMMRLFEEPLTNPGKATAFAKQLQMARDRDAARLFSVRPEIWEDDRSVTTATVRELMSHLFDEYKFAEIPSSKIPIVFRRNLMGNELFAFCCVLDIDEVRNGYWPLSIGFGITESLPKKWVPQSLLIWDSLASFLPGANIYLQHDKSPQRMVIGIAACAALLGLMANQFDSGLAVSRKATTPNR